MAAASKGSRVCICGYGEYRDEFCCLLIEGVGAGGKLAGEVDDGLNEAQLLTV